jgi:hypothetical protein
MIGHKKSQSETVGFIVIILLVMIIGVIFLGIALKPKGGVVTIDAELSNFLTAAGKYTSDCARDYQPNYRSVNDLVSDCYNGFSCLDLRKACDVLNSTYAGMLENFRPGSSELSYYSLAIKYVQNASVEFEEGVGFGYIIFKGNPLDCASKRAGRSYISLSSGQALVQLEVCLAS